MATEFLLPDIGEGLVEATVVEWLANVGDDLALDGPMVEMETDKAITEIPAPFAGILLHQGAAEGETLAVGQVLAVIGEAGETWEPEAVAAAPASTPMTAAPIVGTLEEAPSGVQALPAVRKLAGELGVDLAVVSGSGPGGRITSADVEAAAAGGDVERVSLSPTRKAIAENLARSWREIPHVTTYGEAEAGPLLEARKESGQPLEAHLIAAITPLLAEFPDFNAAFAGDAVVRRRNYDVGFAVDTPEGLMVAVIRGADQMDVPQLGAEVTRLAMAARERKAKLDELRGQTFTISNIGAVGGRYGTPIVPFGTSAILSVGRADPAAGVVDGEIAVVRRFPLSLSYDHRLIDGAQGRAFLAAVANAIRG